MDHAKEEEEHKSQQDNEDDMSVGAPNEDDFIYLDEE